MRPGRRIDDRIIDIIQIYILVAAVLRGCDYLARPQDVVFTTGGVHDAAPVWVWGTVLLSLGVLGLCGEVWFRNGTSRCRWVPSWTAHAGLCALLGVVGLSIMADAAAQGWGWAFGFNLFGFALLHFWFTVRRRREMVA